MNNVHTVYKTRLFKIEDYMINKNDGNKIVYSIFAEISFSSDCIKNEKYSVNIQDKYDGNGLIEIFSGTLFECRKEIKKLIGLYWSDIKFEEVVVTE